METLINEQARKIKNEVEKVIKEIDLNICDNVIYMKNLVMKKQKIELELEELKILIEKTEH